MGSATREPEKTKGGRQNDLMLLYDKLLNWGICVLIQQILSANDIHKIARVLSSRNGLEQWERSEVACELEERQYARV